MFEDNSMIQEQKERGVSMIFFAILATALLLSIGMGLATLLIEELEITGGIGDSVVAISAADAGIEHVLYADVRNCPLSCPQGNANCPANPVELDASSCTVGTGIPCYPGCVTECIEGSPDSDCVIAIDTDEECVESTPDADHCVIQMGTNNVAEYELNIKEDGGALCQSNVQAYCGESVGSYNGARREVQVKR